ncbi:NmrA family NAD(P)-binding protein [Paraburkholderia humisilvae]|uniref:Quinone oxidoreductase 2 n=1 Tax=Paraburkholderia humisilvae TaxID=627669 RepID=A0A6J5DKE4_9BURK|nr:NmrA family NAD(P)-binding protein [Paraburkholderia humisilvae]CAB3753721.1 Quinone oxidoreductase 2 [Paraburkholderia humisilvae]
MYAITGITGQVGGALARALLAEGQPVRAIVRNVDKGGAWAAQGCTIVQADMGDASALAAAFDGAQGVFVLPPSEFDPAPGFHEARAVINAVKAALEIARPAKVVCLSTVGAHAQRPNLLTQRTLMEEALGDLSMPVTFLRPAWFMENAAWDVASARDDGIVPSFLQPLDKAVPMVATADIGRVAAMLLQQEWSGKRVVELEGPRRVSPHDIAAAFGAVLGREVRAQIVPRVTWNDLFRSQGMKYPLPRMQMLDGFNEGWIDFEQDPAHVLKGEVELEAVLRRLVDAGAHAN